VDLLVCLERRHTIGFRYVDITRPVVVHHGSRDTRVPVDNARWLGKTMRRCEVRVLEGEGHGLMASASVMGSVLMEISKEWEDWMRVTGADGRKDRERGRRGTIGR
jgi:pimeloyl-ACP methyl ester carboxylesterase